MSDTVLKITPLTEAHVAAGARMVEFGGYSMPVQYPLGILKEHQWTRDSAGAFDVSHMGPSFLQLLAPTGDPEGDHASICAVLEPLTCGDFTSLKRGQQKYTLLMAEDGGILDDLMVGRPVPDDQQGVLQVVVNAGTKEADFARIAAAAQGKARLIRADDGALIAVQGPRAAEVVQGILPDVADLTFMRLKTVEWRGMDIALSRSGYTGEDGYEILVPADGARAFWDLLLADERVKPIGLGARDSLRLEAGLPLYGHDIDATTSPVEADLGFAIARKRLKADAIAGSARLKREMTGEVTRMRLGLTVLEGAPAREGAEIADSTGRVIGKVTSGGFSPSLGKPIAMGYAPPADSEPGMELRVIVRGKAQRCVVTPLPFVAHRYVRPA